MPITYTNRKGTTYTLFRSETKTGKHRYYFAKSSTKGVPCDNIPDAFEIRESVNGIVSLAKKRPRLILQSEIDLIKGILEEHPDSDDYRIHVKPDRIVIYERIGPDPDEIISIFERHGVAVLANARGRLKANQDKHANYDGVIRFILSDESDRRFEVERMCYLSGIDDWIYIGSGTSLAKLAQDIIPLLGTDDFYDLY